jgi:hypothetical protein
MSRNCLPSAGSTSPTSVTQLGAEVRADDCKAAARGSSSAEPTDGISTRWSSASRASGYLWRAVDHEGEISTSCSAPTRPALGRQAHAKAGLRAKRVVTDKLRSLGAAFQHSGFPVIMNKGSEGIVRETGKRENGGQDSISTWVWSLIVATAFRRRLFSTRSASLSASP